MKEEEYASPNLRTYSLNNLSIMKKVLICILMVTAAVALYSQGSVKYIPPVYEIVAGGNITKSSDTVTPMKFKMNGCEFEAPQGPDELTTAFEFKYSLLSSNFNASLGVLGFGLGDMDRNTRYLVVEFIQKRTFVCPDGDTLTRDSLSFGVGLIALLKIQSTKGKLKIEPANLSQLAANASLGKLKVTYSLRTVGITGPPVLNALPVDFDFTVEEYREFYKVVDLIRNLYLDDKHFHVVPQILPEAVQVP